MAKKKGKSPIIAVGAAAVVVIAVAIILVLLLITPNAEKLAEKYNSEDIIVTYAEKGDNALADISFSVADLTANITGLGFTILYFEDSADAAKYYKEAKDEKDEIKDEDKELADDIFIGKRGKAVFHGTGETAEKALKIFKGQLG